jgi:uncharacterized protein
VTDRITLRSFCVNGNGFVVNEYHRGLGIRAVNGHSFLDRHSGQSNLAILATIEPPCTEDPKAYVRQLARDINAGASGYPIAQPLHTFLPGGCHGPAQGVQASSSRPPRTSPARCARR